MSLLDQAATNLSPYKLMISEKASLKDEKKFIIQPSILKDILSDEMSNRVIDKKAKKEFASYRTKLEKVEWRLAGMLNFVDEEIYREQIEKTIHSMLKHIRLRQPNGEWVIMDYEIDIRKNKKNDDALMLAVKFVDAKNESDMRYQNGIPAVDVNVDVSGRDQALIEAIQAQSGGSDNAELIATLNRFIESMTPKDSSAKETKAKVKEDNVLDEIPGDFSE